ncbi:hypothetical protein BTO06_03940 [Tenacibaculum sp. SZ-18]|uniref:hypothetical protein n=1 Tax=Tenacibaculum sp. SZ-18 TaxID=754423 RepID=UPI000C2D4405|nr:hypothetical protein [Tenacibaculum sp. SZ-18]AUC14343.1 hypothetical protein BTO06_03940 [Tenacibaculum sp. SZ-18]
MKILQENQGKILTEIGLYNHQVKKYLQKNQLTPIDQQTIKLFTDSAQRQRLNPKKYNKLVEEFNSRHGFMIKKMGEESIATPYYDYLNIPVLMKEDIAKAMTNFRQFMIDYNKEAVDKNDEIKKYNSTVKVFLSLSVKEKSIIDDFRRTNSSLHISRYNELVEKENLKNNIHPKLKYRTLKQQYSDTFHSLIFFYASQLQKRNQRLIGLSKPTSVKKNELPKVRINYRDLVTFKIDGVRRLQISKRTAQNHVQVFVEAGLINNYCFFSKNRPVFADFNSKVVILSDLNPPQSKAPVKPKKNTSKTKAVHIHKYNTRTPNGILKEEKIKECANSTQGKKSGSISESMPDFYKNTNSIERNQTRAGEKKEIFNGPSLKRSKKVLEMEERFLNKVLDEKKFSELLVNNEFINHKGLRYDYLETILMYTKVTSDEFKKVVIQDFIKIASKIWKNHDVFEGEWLKAIRIIQNNFFKNINTKKEIIKHLRQYRWKIEFARKWFNKTEVKALYPFSYFDPNRTFKEEIGFYGLHRIFKSHIRLKNKEEAEGKRLLHEANSRKRRIKEERRKLQNQRKFKAEYDKLIKGELNIEQLYIYVQENLPDEFLSKLQQLVNINS